MKEKIEQAQYALTNLETMKENIFAYASYAKSLCDVTDIYGGLEDKINQAENGLDCLIDYIKNIVNIADPPKKFRAVMEYEGKHYTFNVGLDKDCRNYDDEDYCYWLLPLDKDNEKGKWVELNMEMVWDEKSKAYSKPTGIGYAVVYSSYEEMINAGDGEENLPEVKFHRA